MFTLIINYTLRILKKQPVLRKMVVFLALSTIIKLVLSMFHNKIRLLCRPAPLMAQRKEVIMKIFKTKIPLIHFE